MAQDLRETVRQRYAQAASEVSAGGCCDGDAATTAEPDERFTPPVADQVHSTIIGATEPGAPSTGR